MAAGLGVEASIETRMFAVFLDGAQVTSLESDRVRVLLAYLAVEADRSHRPERLAGLLWPEWPEARARQNLSQALFNLREAIGDHQAEPSLLLINRATLQFNPSRMLEGLHHLVDCHTQRGEYELALPYARRQVGSDSLNESAHRQLMIALRLVGKVGGRAAPI